MLLYLKLYQQLFEEAQKKQAKSLIFLKTGFLQLCAKRVWDEIVPLIPDKPKDDTKKLEDVIKPDEQNSHFIESGLYVCRDGYDFSGLAAFEQSQSLATFFELSIRKNKKEKLENDSRLLVSQHWLFNTGLRFINWLANESGYYLNYLENNDDIYNMNDDDWIKFFDCRMQHNLVVKYYYLMK